jgi:hypothetical protein
VKALGFTLATAVVVILGCALITLIVRWFR